MIDFLRLVAGLVTDLVRGRAVLVAENALLRQQLIVAQRKIAGRIRWAPWQRFTIGLAVRIVPAWRAAILLVQPATVLRWHRAGFRVFWSPTLSAVGSTSYAVRRAHPRDCRAQPALASCAETRSSGPAEILGG